MKTIRYTANAARDLRRYGTMAARLRAALAEYAEDGSAHANNVTRLVGSTALRLRVGDFRIIFAETATELLVTRVGPRGDVYE